MHLCPLHRRLPHPINKHSVSNIIPLVPLPHLPHWRTRPRSRRTHPVTQPHKLPHSTRPKAIIINTYRYLRRFYHLRIKLIIISLGFRVVRARRYLLQARMGRQGMPTIRLGQWKSILCQRLLMPIFLRRFVPSSIVTSKAECIFSQRRL